MSYIYVYIWRERIQEWGLPLSQVCQDTTGLTCTNELGLGSRDPANKKLGFQNSAFFLFSTAGTNASVLLLLDCYLNSEKRSIARRPDENCGWFVFQCGGVSPEKGHSCSVAKSLPSTDATHGVLREYHVWANVLSHALIMAPIEAQVNYWRPELHVWQSGSFTLESCKQLAAKETGSFI